MHYLVSAVKIAETRNRQQSQSYLSLKNTQKVETERPPDKSLFSQQLLP